MHPSITARPTTPFTDQKPGTSGLRKKTPAFMAPNYTENFLQSIFDAIREDHPEGFGSVTFVVGGDGRFYNREAIQKLIKIAAGNGVGQLLVGCGGLLSTPAASAVIRSRPTGGGFIFSASHNPGGPHEDFGIKFNTPQGGPAPEKVTSKIFEATKKISQYRWCTLPDVDLDSIGSTRIAGTQVEVIDPIAEYLALLEQWFDFDKIAALFKSGFSMLFDGMNAITGPYATEIFERRLGAAAGTVLRGQPLPDFGGGHPDPNLVYAHELVEKMAKSNAPAFGAASDGDGDRNLILGRNFFVSPGDSLAVITHFAAETIPGLKGKVFGVARSMPTSRAADVVAQAIKIPCFETPTGWKFFGNLLDAEMASICGEESFGTGSSHVREKDGIWTVLAWLSILAHTQKDVAEIMHEHWDLYGRHYFQRHDYEALPLERATELMATLGKRIASVVGTSFAGSTIKAADDFTYHDPVDHSISSNQGIRLVLEDNSRVVFRLSGTGTEGATVRLYFERFKKDGGKGDLEKTLAPLVAATLELLDLQGKFGVTKPTVVT